MVSWVRVLARSCKQTAMSASLAVQLMGEKSVETPYVELDVTRRNAVHLVRDRQR
mgnify:CR=1 FL=1